MRERGLVFIADHVPKVLDGSKTVTRRLGGLKEINERPDDFAYRYCQVHKRLGGGVDVYYIFRDKTKSVLEDTGILPVKCPHGVPGDRFYLKETWGVFADVWQGETSEAMRGKARTYHKARLYEDNTDLAPAILETGMIWKSPRFMPKWAARPERWELVSVRPERVQDITSEDVIVEGIPFADFCPGLFLPKLSEEKLRLLIEKTAKAVYGKLWDSINAKRGYPFEHNNWVFRYEWNPEPVVKG